MTNYQNILILRKHQYSRKKKVLYGLNFARTSRKREIIVVEGYMDAIALYQAGFTNAVATLGTAFTQHHARLLKSCADSVILLFDSDTAGINAVYKALPYLKNEGLTIKVAQTENAKDPDDYIRQFGAKSFEELLKNAKSHIAFQIENQRNKFDLENNIDDRVKFTKAVSSILSKVDSAIERDAYIKETSRQTGISQEAITEETFITINNDDFPKQAIVSRQKNYVVSQRKYSKGLIKAQKGLLSLIAANETAFKKSRTYIEKLEFTDVVYSKLFSLISALYDSNTPIEAASLISCFETVDEQQIAAEALNLNITIDVFVIEKELNEQLKTIKKYNIEKKMNEASEKKDDKALLMAHNEQKTVEMLYISLVDG